MKQLQVSKMKYDQRNLFQRNKQGDIVPGNVVLKQWMLSVMQKTVTQFFQK